MLAKSLAPLLVVATLLAGTWFWGAVVAPGYTSAIILVAAWFVLCSMLFSRAGKARPELRWWLRGTFLACSAASLVAFYVTSLRDTVVDEKLPDAVPASELAASSAGQADRPASRFGSAKADAEGRSESKAKRESKQESAQADEPQRTRDSGPGAKATATANSRSAAKDQAAAKPRAQSKPASKPQAAKSESVPKPKPKPATNVVERTGAVRPTSHSAKGTARVVKLASGGRTLTFSDGFEIDPGPEIRVYLATDGSAGRFKDLGSLKGSKGDQQYKIPAGLDLGTYDTVVLYCIPFTVSVAQADLRPA